MAANAVEQLKAKFVQRLQNTKLLRELREFDTLIKAIGECKSKAEEDRIIATEVELLKQRLADPRIDKTRGREYLVRLLYCELLGHDVSWAYVRTLQFASEPSVLCKKAAYLALTQFIDHKHELVLLLVNTLLSDLKSDNFINVCTALVVCTRLIGPDLISAVYPVVVERLRHPREHVRKKAVMALHRFHQLDPLHEGALSGMEVDKHFRTMLCDKDPGVMSAALCALYDVVRQDPRPFKNLIPSFTSILKQVSEHRLPKSYDYHKFPAPFIQIKLLKILALLGAGDRSASENMYTVVQQTLRRANTSHTIGSAIIFECVACITAIYPNPHLLAAAAEAIAVFLKSPSHNLRYVGVDALAIIIKINPNLAQEHQAAVAGCLDDPDDTLKLKTLELLYKMTKGNNVESVTERMMGFLRTTTDDHIKRDIARKVCELAERYAPSASWFIQVVSEVFELGGHHVDPAMAHSLMHLIAEQDADLHRSAVQQYLKLLDPPSGSQSLTRLPDVLIQVVVWVLGEYGVLAASPASGELGMQPQQVMSRLVAVVSGTNSSDTVRQMLLPALTKLCIQGKTGLPVDAEAWVHKASRSQDTELQQRAYELQILLDASPQVQAVALPHDVSCMDISDSDLQDIKQLTFLGWYVDEALNSGAQPYAPEASRAYRARSPSVATASAGLHALRFDAYEVAPLPGGPTADSSRPQGLGGAPAATAAATAPAAVSPADLLFGSLTLSSLVADSSAPSSTGRPSAGPSRGAPATTPATTTAPETTQAVDLLDLDSSTTPVLHSQQRSTAPQAVTGATHTNQQPLDLLGLDLLTASLGLPAAAHGFSASTQQQQQYATSLFDMPSPAGQGIGQTVVLPSAGTLGGTSGFNLNVGASQQGQQGSGLGMGASTQARGLGMGVGGTAHGGSTAAGAWGSALPMQQQGAGIVDDMFASLGVGLQSSGAMGLGSQRGGGVAGAGAGSMLARTQPSKPPAQSKQQPDPFADLLF